MKFKRVYHPYWLWEEVKHNMWGDSKDKKRDTNMALIFTGDHELYGYYMMKVIKEWKYSCENSLTDYLLNRKAWVGHAACALALEIPEYIVREAWRLLTDEQRLLANRKAERAIQCWEDGYKESGGLC